MKRAPASVGAPAMVPFEKYDALVQLVAQMKREGFTTTMMASELPAKSTELPGLVQAAIVGLEVDRDTQRHLTRQAWEMLRAGVEPQVIAEKLTAGEDVPL